MNVLLECFNNLEMFSIVQYLIVVVRITDNFNRQVAALMFNHLMYHWCNFCYIVQLNNSQ